MVLLHAKSRINDIVEKRRESKISQMFGRPVEDVREVRRRYEYGRFDEARYLLYGIVDDCVACHTRLPSGDGAPKAEAFIGALDDAAQQAAARLGASKQGLVERLIYGPLPEAGELQSGAMGAASADRSAGGGRSARGGR